MYFSFPSRQRFGAIPVLVLLLLGCASPGRGGPRKASDCTSQKMEQYLVTQQYSAAAAAIEKHLSACSPSSLLYLRLGFAYYYSGEPEKALQALRTAREWKTAEVHVQLAEGNHQVGNHRNEVAEAQRALAGVPNSTEALLVLGRG